MSKMKAFLIHFGLSFLIVSTCAAVVFVVWYPGIYFHVFDATEVLKILVAVDLVLGPALTLLLFKPGKPGLVFDLCVIAALQLSALVYGVLVTYSERPYVTVFAVDRFEVLTEQDVDVAAVDPTLLDSDTMAGPPLVVAVMPDDPREVQQLMEETLFDGKPDIQKRPQYWQSYEDAYGDVMARARPVDELLGRDAASEQRIRSLLDEKSAGEELVYIPIMGRQRVFSLVLDTGSREPVALLDLDPWEAGAIDMAEG